jgi:hypothetical protein
MAHFAQLDENNTVLQVIVVANEKILDENEIEKENLGISFCKDLFGSDTKWKQTSYNHNIRFRYAGIGYSYDEDLDVFLFPKPYPSWTLNMEIMDWESPTPKPELTEQQMDMGMRYYWNEDSVNWDLMPKDT